jgi:hypothetical protein
MGYPVANLMYNLRQLGVMVPCTVDIVKAQAVQFQLEMLNIQRDLTEALHAYAEQFRPPINAVYEAANRLSPMIFGVTSFLGHAVGTLEYLFQSCTTSWLDMEDRCRAENNESFTACKESTKYIPLLSNDCNPLVVGKLICASMKDMQTCEVIRPMRSWAYTLPEMNSHLKTILTSLNIHYISIENVTSTHVSSMNVEFIKQSVRNDVTDFFDGVNWWLAAIHIVMLIKSCVIMPIVVYRRLSRSLKDRRKGRYRHDTRRSSVKIVTCMQSCLAVTKFLAFFIPCACCIFAFCLEWFVDWGIGLINSHANVTYESASFFNYGFYIDTTNPVTKFIKKMLPNFEINRKFNITSNPRACLPVPVPPSPWTHILFVVALYGCVLLMTIATDWVQTVEENIIDHFYNSRGEVRKSRRGKKRQQLAYDYDSSPSPKRRR